jgi:hypothetical protein
VIAIGAIMDGLARVVQGELLTIREQDVEAARARRPIQVFARHVPARTAERDGNATFGVDGIPANRRCRFSDSAYAGGELGETC